jgi:hypothetical protein
MLGYSCAVGVTNLRHYNLEFVMYQCATVCLTDIIVITVKSCVFAHDELYAKMFKLFYVCRVKIFVALKNLDYMRSQCSLFRQWDEEIARSQQSFCLTFRVLSACKLNTSTLQGSLLHLLLVIMRRLKFVVVVFQIVYQSRKWTGRTYIDMEPTSLSVIVFETIDDGSKLTLVLYF